MRCVLYLCKNLLVVLLHFLHYIGLGGPSDNEPLLISCCRLGDDVEVHMVNDLIVQTSVSLRDLNPMNEEGNEPGVRYGRYSWYEINSAPKSRERWTRTGNWDAPEGCCSSPALEQRRSSLRWALRPRGIHLGVRGVLLHGL